MSLVEPKTESTEGVEVHLLDPTAGSSMKTWRFNGETRITIGRGDDCIVEILDPHVSRLHAALSLHEGRWILISLGRNGVLVGSKAISEEPISDGVTFRLGPMGPSLRFCLAAEKKAEYMQTLCFDADAMPFFVLDKSKLQDEVSEIASEDFFLKLQQKAQALRRQRKEP